MTRQAQPIRLYRHPLSGHAHRVQLMLSLLDLPAELIDIDLVKGEQKSSAFIARNPFGQVPVIEDGDVTLADSNAILVYLASRYDAARHWYPNEPVAAAHVQQWLSVAAGQLAFGPAAARVNHLFRRQADTSPMLAMAAQLYGIMEALLAAQPFLAADHPTIADVAHYSYTAHAPEGGVSLERYPAIRTWLSRIEALPGFVGMQRSPVPQAA